MIVFGQAPSSSLHPRERSDELKQNHVFPLFKKHNKPILFSNSICIVLALCKMYPKNSQACPRYLASIKAISGLEVKASLELQDK